MAILELHAADKHRLVAAMDAELLACLAWLTDSLGSRLAQVRANSVDLLQAGYCTA